MPRTVYTASKVHHAHKWRALRAGGLPVISTWIDEAGVGESSDLSDLWARCIAETMNADLLIVYREPGEILKGAFIELGAALASGKPVYAVGIEEFTVAHHRGIRHFETLDLALAAAASDQGIGVQLA